MSERGDLINKHRAMDMEHAGRDYEEWKPLNRRQSDRVWYQVALTVLTFVACIGFWQIFNWVEHFFRNHP